MSFVVEGTVKSFSLAFTIATLRVLYPCHGMQIGVFVSEYFGNFKQVENSCSTGTELDLRCLFVNKHSSSNSGIGSKGTFYFDI